MSEIEKDLAWVTTEYAQYAQEQGFRLNPDHASVERVIKGLLANEIKYGQRYCPCRRLTNNPEEDAKKICPCAYHQEELTRDGHCYCGLFSR